MLITPSVISGNAISSIDIGAFAATTSLAHLYGGVLLDYASHWLRDLSYNHITYVAPEHLKGLFLLSYLFVHAAVSTILNLLTFSDVSNNFITEVPPFAFDDLISLTFLFADVSDFI